MSPIDDATLVFKLTLKAPAACHTHGIRVELYYGFVGIDVQEYITPSRMAIEQAEKVLEISVVRGLRRDRDVYLTSAARDSVVQRFQLFYDKCRFLPFAGLDLAFGDHHFVILEEGRKFRKSLAPRHALDAARAVFEPKCAKPVAFLTVPDL